jgi:hypothetical protein
MRYLRLIVMVALLAPAAGSALEPRFDHRDQHGPIVEALIGYDTVAVSGRPTESSWRPALRIAYGADILGEGNELVLGAQGTLASWSDPDREKVLLAFDLRYRAYFGTEEFKTFFDVGLWLPVVSRLAAGPLVAIGGAYDFTRAGGIYVAGGFGTAFGQARIASFTGSVGAQFRF